MKRSEHDVPGSGGPSSSVYTALIAIGFAAPVVTFSIAVAELSSNTKVIGLAAVSAVYFLICLWSYRRLRADSQIGADDPRDILDSKLHALEEANEFFGTSLKPADTFRLVSSRIRDIYPFDSSVFFVVDPVGAELVAAYADGSRQDILQACRIEKGRGLAGLAVLSGEVEYAPDLAIDQSVFGGDALAGLSSSAAIPLIYNDAVFGLIQLFGEAKLPGDAGSLSILTAVGERVAPLMRGSVAFGETLSNALTDSLTKLPNERAFFMVLENQLAESLRQRDERHLSVLALDINNLDHDDRAISAVESERMIGFTGEIIRSQLRKMDFLARSVSDEFLLILPTADDETVREIVNRIMLAFAQTPFTAADGEEIRVRINFGASSFWKDGETASQLLQSARLRKQQAKSEDPQKLLLFPKQYVN